MRLHLTEVIQIIVPLHHVTRRVKGVCRHLHCWGDDGVPGSLSPVEQQRRHHDSGGQRRFGVFFGDQYKHFCNVPAPGFGIIGAEQCGNEIENPLCAGFTKRWRSWCINNFQLLEHIQGYFSLLRVNRGRNYRLAFLQSFRPVRAGSCPLRHYVFPRLLTTSFGGGGTANLLAAFWAASAFASFLPPSPFF